MHIVTDPAELARTAYKEPQPERDGSHEFRCAAGHYSYSGDAAHHPLRSHGDCFCGAGVRLERCPTGCHAPTIVAAIA